MIEFVSFFLGLVIGIHPVQVAVSADVALLELRLDGRLVGSAQAEPWTIDCDFGDQLLPHELVANAFGSDGHQLAGGRQWINMPRPDAEVGVLLERDDQGRPFAARVTWEALSDDQIPRILATLDGSPLIVEDPHRITLPEIDQDAAHVLVVSVDFGEGIEASDEVAFGRFHGSEYSSELTAVPVAMSERQTPPSIDELQSSFNVNGEIARVLGIERRQGQVVFVRDGDAADVATTWSDATRREVSAGRSVFGTLNADDRIRLISPFAGAKSGTGIEVILFPISPWFFKRSVPLILAGLTSPSTRGLDRALADAVAVAGVEAARGNHPRAVVVLLGKGDVDHSTHSPEAVRRFLESLRVPLFVWRLGRKENPDWPGADYVAFYSKLTDAVGRLRRSIDSQQIVWIEGRHLPQSVRLVDPSGPVRLAGGLEVPYPHEDQLKGEVGAADDSQTLPAGTPTFAGEVEVIVVNVEAFVRDRKGRPITDLRREDFRLKVDGVETPLSHFSVETGPRLGALEPDVLSPIQSVQQTEHPLPAHVVLFVDNQNLMPFSRRRALDEAKRFVVESVGPSVEMMVVNRQLGMEVVQPFTDRGDEVVAALETMRNETGGRTSHQGVRRALLNDIEACNNSRQRQICIDRLRRVAEMTAREERLMVLQTIRDLELAVESLGGLPGRKALVYVSNGLPMIPGLDLVLPVVDPQEMSRLRPALDCSRDFSGLVETSLRSGVSLYAIDAAGLSVPAGTSAQASSPAMHQYDFEISNNIDAAILYFSAATGGHAVVNTNRIGLGLESLRDDLFSYYSIGFTVPALSRDTPHPIDVRLPQHSDLTVRHRDVVYEKSADTRAREVVMAGLMTGESDNPIEMEIVLGDAVTTRKGVIEIPVRIVVPIANISLAPIEDDGDFSGRLLVFVASKGPGGRTSEIAQQEFEFVVRAEDLTQAIQQAFAVETSILVAPDDVRVSVAVADPASGVVSYRSFSPHPSDQGVRGVGSDPGNPSSV